MPDSPEITELQRDPGVRSAARRESAVLWGTGTAVVASVVVVWAMVAGRRGDHVSVTELLVPAGALIACLGALLWWELTLRARARAEQAVLDRWPVERAGWYLWDRRHSNLLRHSTLAMLFGVLLVVSGASGVGAAAPAGLGVLRRVLTWLYAPGLLLILVALILLAFASIGNLIAEHHRQKSAPPDEKGLVLPPARRVRRPDGP